MVSDHLNQLSITGGLSVQMSSSSSKDGLVYLLISLLKYSSYLRWTLKVSPEKGWWPFTQEYLGLQQLCEPEQAGKGSVQIWRKPFYLICSENDNLSTSNSNCYNNNFYLNTYFLHFSIHSTGEQFEQPKCFWPFPLQCPSFSATSHQPALSLHMTDI